MREGIFRYYVPGSNATSLVDGQGNPKVAASDIGTFDVFSIDPTRLGPDTTGIVAGKLQQIPLPNNFDIGDGFNLAGFRYNSDLPFDEDQFVIKGDHHFSKNHRLAVSVGWYQQEDLGPELVSGFRQDAFDEGRISGTVALTSTFSPSFLNEFRLGGQKRDTNRFPTHPDSFDRRGNFQLRGLGRGRGGGRNGNPQGVFLPQVLTTAVINLADNITWIKRNHTFKGGGRHPNQSFQLFCWRGFLHPRG